EQFGQGEAPITPLPLQRSHSPPAVRVRPDPWHSGQRSLTPPFAAPVPTQTAHTSRRGTITTFSVPSAASRNVSATATSTSAPRSPPAAGVPAPGAPGVRTCALGTRYRPAS